MRARRREEGRPGSAWSARDAGFPPGRPSRRPTARSPPWSRPSLRTARRWCGSPPAAGNRSSRRQTGPGRFPCRPTSRGATIRAASRTASATRRSTPTAGLHFTHELLGEIRARGVRTADLTLHVGLGTFRPIATETIEEHRIHTEPYEIPADTQRALFPPLGGRRVAVGTTTVRSIEDFLSDHEEPLGRAHLA